MVISIRLFAVADDDKLLCIACLDGDHTNALCRRRNEIYNAENVIHILQDMNTKKYFFGKHWKIPKIFLKSINSFFSFPNTRYKHHQRLQTNSTVSFWNFQAVWMTLERILNTWFTGKTNMSSMRWMTPNLKRRCGVHTFWAWRQKWAGTNLVPRQSKVERDRDHFFSPS